MMFDPEFQAYSLGPPQGGGVTFVERLDATPVDTDADFECKRLVCFFNPGGAPQTEATRRIPQVNFNIRDTSTGRLMFSKFADTAELFGDGRIPFVLPTSHFFRRGGQIQILYDPVTPGPDFDNGQLWLILLGANHFEKG